MNVIDVLIATLLVIGAARGFIKGIVVEFFSLLALIAGVTMCLYLNPGMIDLLGGAQAFSGWKAFAIYIICFLLTYAAVYLLGIWVEKIFMFAGLNLFNRIAGALFSFCKVMFFISIVLWIMNSLDLLAEGITSGSYFYGFSVGFAPFLLNKGGEILPLLQGIVENTESYLEQILLDFSDEGSQSESD